MTEINVAIVGCGAVANSHFAAWRRIPYAKIKAVCDSNNEAAEKAARNWRVPLKFNSVFEMIDSKVITLWDICTPIQTHKDLAIQAMKNGFDVLIEKPLTITSKEAKEIVECQNTTGKKAGVIHNWLFEPPILKARAVVEHGDLGEIISAQIDVLHTKDEPMTANQNHWSHKLPGGRLSEMLIHPIYLLRYFVGGIDLASVEVSKIGEYPWMKYDELFATFKADEKLAGTYVSFSAPRNSIYVNLFGRRGIIRLDIINATVNVLPSVSISRFNKVLDSTRQAIQLSASTLENALKVLTKQWFDGHEMCIRLFAESIVEEKEPPVPVQEGYEVVKVLEDMYLRIESL